MRCRETWPGHRTGEFGSQLPGCLGWLPCGSMTTAVPAIDAGWKELSGNLEEQREANIAVGKIMSGSMLDMETPEGLAIARKFLEDLAAGGAAPEIEPELRTVNGVPVRIFIPEIQKIRGVYLHIHGGGWAVGTASMNDVSNAEI